MKPNNKGRREELTRLKSLKRLKNYLGNKISAGSIDKYLNTKSQHNMFALKTTGKPCSCELCSPYKYRKERAKIKRQWLKEEKMVRL